MSNRAENRKFHYTYSVTCTNENRAGVIRTFYGLHSSDVMEDSFSGAGSALYESIKDYGKAAHIFSMLQIYPTRNEAKLAYAELKAAELLNPKHPNRYAFHYIYRIARFDGKFYIGVHSTNTIDDGYMGSGTYITRSIKKYGRDKHSRQIIEMCSSREEAMGREIALVQEARLNPACMNLCAGGSSVHRVYGVTEETRAKMSEHFKTVVRTPEWCARISASQKGKIIPEARRAAHSAKLKGRKQPLKDVEARRLGLLRSEKFQKTKRPVIIHGVQYETGFIAGEMLNIPGKTIWNRCGSKYFKDYRFADADEKMSLRKVLARSKAVLINGISYPNKKIAYESTGITPKMIHTRCLSDKFPDFYYQQPSPSDLRAMENINRIL